MTHSGPRRVVVVGGGVTGLAAVHALGTSGAHVDLFDAEPRLGGQIRTERVGGYLLESGPDTLVSAKPGARELCRRIGLGDELFAVRSSQPPFELVWGGRLHPLPDGFALAAPARLRPLLRTPLLSWRGKLRMCFETIVPPKHGADDETVRAFVERRLGREAYERIAEPIFGGLFLADAGRMSATWAAPRLVELERRHGSVVRGLRRAAPPRAPAAPFEALERGMASIVERLCERLGSARVHAGRRVDSLRFDAASGRWLVQPSGAEPVAADAVILACPAWASARLVRDVEPGLARELASIEYASCATVHLAYPRASVRRPPAGHGFFVPRAAGLPLLACTDVGAKFPGRAPRDVLLLRAFLGGASDPGAARRPEDELVGRAHAALADLLDIEGPPVLTRADRIPHAMPQFPAGHASRLESIDRMAAALPGLVLAGGAAGAVGIPDCVRSGERAAERALAGAAERRLHLVG
jgi:oxygen-dependent protoporphyrinogen oxidase